MYSNGYFVCYIKCFLTYKLFLESSFVAQSWLWLTSSPPWLPVPSAWQGSPGCAAGQGRWSLLFRQPAPLPGALPTPPPPFAATFLRVHFESWSPLYDGS